jgi:hypothetical protein
VCVRAVTDQLPGGGGGGIGAANEDRRCGVAAAGSVDLPVRVGERTENGCGEENCGGDQGANFCFGRD